MTELTAALMYSELFAPVAHVDDVANTRSRSQTLPVRRQCARCRPRPHRAHMGRAHRARARARLRSKRTCRRKTRKTRILDTGNTRTCLYFRMLDNFALIGAG